jgi:hypothetical protein
MASSGFRNPALGGPGYGFGGGGMGFGTGFGGPFGGFEMMPGFGFFP